MKSQRQTHLPFLLAAALSFGLLTGCSGNFAPNPVRTDQSPIGNIQGAVHGGQAPIVGAAIYLYAAGTGGYGNGATSLLQADANTAADGSGNYYVTTDAYGGFNISGDYTCTAGQQVYIIAVGGDAGSGPNSAIVQMAGLGTCPVGSDLAATVPFVMINEVSTVVFAYAMGGFGSSAYKVSSSSTPLAETGTTNAMANVSNILNIGTGTAYAQVQGNANSTVPQAEINTLANILTECVNSSGPTSSQCTSLFADAPDLSGNPATDEATAIFNIVHNPASSAANVTALFNLSTKQYIFTPYLPAAPSDWTLPIVYNNVVGTPYNIAFDTSGNAWIGDKTKHAVIEMSPLGAVSTFNTNQSNGNQAFQTIKGVAVAPNGTLWATDFDQNVIYVMDSSGTVESTITANLVSPSSIAFDASGDAYVANETAGTSTITSYSLSGAAEDAGTALADINEPAWIAVDGNDRVWVPSTPGTGDSDENIGVVAVTTTVNGKGNLVTKYKGDVYAANGSYAIAVDASNNLWSGDIPTDGTLEEWQAALNGNGKLKGVTVVASHSNGGLSTPYMASVDGSGTVWIANSGASTVSGYSQVAKKWLADSTAVGLQTGATGSCLAATPDGSGNLWTANSDGTVTELLGVATPTATPLMPGNLGVEP